MNNSNSTMTAQPTNQTSTMGIDGNATASPTSNQHSLDLESTTPIESISTTMDNSTTHYTNYTNVGTSNYTNTTLTSTNATGIGLVTSNTTFETGTSSIPIPTNLTKTTTETSYTSTTFLDLNSSNSSNSSTALENTVTSVPPINKHVVTTVIGTSTAKAESSHTIAGIDQDLFIIGSIIVGLLLVVVVVAIVMCVLRKRRRNKALKLKSTSTPFSTTPGSPSTPTVNVSERMELINGTPLHPGEREGVSFTNNGAVAYHKESEYIAIWAVDEFKEQQKQQQQHEQNQQQQQNSLQQQHKRGSGTRVEINKKAAIPQSNSPTTNPVPYSESDLEHSVYVNHSPDMSSTTTTGRAQSSHDHHRIESQDENDDHNVYANYTFGASSLTSASTHHSAHISNHGQDLYERHSPDPSPYNDTDYNSRRHSITRSPDSNLEHSVYANYTPVVSSLLNRNPNSPHDGFGHVNEGYEDDKAKTSKETSKAKRLQENTQTTDFRTNNVGLGQSLAPSENYYEDDEPVPDYDDNDDEYEPTRLSRDSGIGVDRDSDSYYDVPAALLDQLRHKYVLNKPENRNSTYVTPSPIMRHQKSLIESKGSESDYYMGSSRDSTREIHNSLEESDQNYENTKVKRPETYLGPDDLELKSPTDEDELLKIYDNFALRDRKLSESNDDNSCLYEIPSELDEIDGLPSTRASYQHPHSQDLPHHPNRLQKFLSSSLPIKTGTSTGGKNENAFLMKSISQESEAVSEYEEAGGLSSPASHPRFHSANIGSPKSNYINSLDNYYENSISSDTQDSEAESVEYHTPKTVSQSPFFQHIDKNKIKLGTRSLPPGAKPPPPRLKKPTPLHRHDQIDQDPKNKSLTLDDSSKRNNPRPSGKKKAMLPFDKSSPLMYRLDPIGNRIPEVEEESSNAYDSPRPSRKQVR